MATIKGVLPLAGFAIIFCATSAWGQTKILRGNIPFDFHIGEQHFSGGDYEVVIDMPFEDTCTLRSSTGEHGAVGICLSDQTQNRASNQSRLVFNRYGEHEYFLSEIWHPLKENSLKLRQSKHEVVTSKLIAGIQKPEKVVIWAALRLP